MAILQEGTVLSGIRGKIGNVVIYQWKNKVCARSTQTRLHKKPRTTAQKSQTGKMKVLSPFLNPVSEFLQVGFRHVTKDQDLSANNAAKSVNMKNAIKGEFPDQEINWDTILVAEGELIKPENVKVTVAENSFIFTWDKDKTNTASPTDRAIILLYSKTHGWVYANYSGARRDELKDSFRIRQKHFKNNTYEVFIAFKDVRSDEVSRSVYCGRFTN
ncbi:hypothetical protein HDF26_002180 [Pedobacter cryoconitis]|uniref:Uncharacterized protein n=1 Tax=Pedobacter cryoconitis TaxID=188932 RepID=A0A7W9DXM5_9SPHI|nr:DUF6266 family protein [Pedobacter cryoconitis]MBB5635093.1 hypothetical protein [Pedobacter cryoconitis]MBB6271723.1 hypothetical protein [Pedobacter cryoconitis]